ncbi:PREDICTED: protein N-lysine methyltransferase METTL20-like isoform X1 [Polistes canadensis]|uniref:protein N-lysine methyltransferase METTL20-like isoform X1 n=2 Tax=Polistes canadensis TaxID=91411 RepID=UPI000718CB1F|nr:PREDICTED: protein N-lysine methyltransferase METTL20-like isoform X1 [Polistes canadensis]
MSWTKIGDMKRGVKILHDLHALIKRPMSRNSAGNLIETIRNRNWQIFDRDIVERDKIVDTILKYTEITNDHMTPDLKLFLLTPKCSLYYDSFDKIKKKLDQVEIQTLNNPFWSIYWPGGQGLVKFIFDEQTNIFTHSKKDINVLDLGTGCGATAIAAKLLGIRNVMANDIDKVACIATLMNATLNGVDVQVSWDNLLDRPLEKSYDVIFIGDLLYEEELTETLIPWLLDVAKKGTRIFLGDPGRHGLTDKLKQNLKLLRQYELPENTRKENNGYRDVYVWQFIN